ncbi:hypothetical protein [Nocardia pseudobrasiliensis]|uniref:Catalytic LigB subunit of aromatic ring-opening dioxygenase n=1 Tax=Nocardia pseudobrasiliensis TaxID=45979 RepID=A0A370I4A7_9NOCA|nr:hypothetical protein [Nocardia pseudobrasiliensis]RDI65572.1 hypothetical protein DFR76_106444 [Nocardia pseudobrasiliensis]
MPLISAAICPHPPYLIPEVAGAAAPEWAGLHTACTESLRRLRIPQFGVKADGWAVFDSFDLRPADASTPDLVVIVGGDSSTRTYDGPGSYSSLEQQGIDWDFGWGRTTDNPIPLPLSLSLGHWILFGCSPTALLVADLELQAVAFDAPPQECAELGRALAARAERVAMLVIGDGTGSDHTRIASALAHADAAALDRLDPTPTPSGRAPWQVLAGAAEGHRFTGELRSDEKSHRAGFFVANWFRA